MLIRGQKVCVVQLDGTKICHLKTFEILSNCVVGYTKCFSNDFCQYLIGIV